MFGNNIAKSQICEVMNGEELKILREKYNLTQKEVAEAIETDVSRISEWENNRFKISKSYQKLLTSFFDKFKK
jgi:DNA-binding transcriptional regulator YiaG